MTSFCRAVAKMSLMAAFLTMPTAVPALDFTDTPDEAVVGRIEAALLDFRAKRSRSPESVDELNEFAWRAARPLDFTAFTGLSLSQGSSNTVVVRYTTGAGERGVFAITVIDVQLER